MHRYDSAELSFATVYKGNNIKINNGLPILFLDTPPPAIEPVYYTYLGMKQLMAGAGVAIVGMVLVPLLSGLFTV